MNPRLNPYKVAPEMMKAMLDLSAKVESSGLEPSLMELVKTRASQLNGFVYEGTIDGLPGFVTVEPEGVLQTTALAIEEGRIVALYITRNPDKLRAIRRVVREDVT